MCVHVYAYVCVLKWLGRRTWTGDRHNPHVSRQICPCVHECALHTCTCILCVPAGLGACVQCILKFVCVVECVMVWGHEEQPLEFWFRVWGGLIFAPLHGAHSPKFHTILSLYFITAMHSWTLYLYFFIQSWACEIRCCLVRVLEFQKPEKNSNRLLRCKWMLCFVLLHFHFLALSWFCCL